MLVIRATPANPSAAVEEMADQAILSSERYVIEREDARRELLYGVSVFAHRDGQDLTDVLYRFPAAPMFVEAAVGVIRGAGFEVLPTGTDADHFDVQLISGVAEADAPPSEQDVRVAASRLLDAAAPIRPNPSYAVGRPVRLEEE
jgi:hypothetical protein